MQELVEIAKAEGYTHVRVIEDKVCGLLPFIFTWGLVIGIDRSGYEYRYCFEDLAEALWQMENWNGQFHPGVRWVKVKGNYKGVHVNHRPDQIREDGMPMTDEEIEERGLV